MFYSGQVFNSLIKSISNYVCFLKRKNRFRQQQDRSNHGKVFYKIAPLPLMLQTLKNTSKEVHFFVKLMLEAYNFIKNELLCRHFSDSFTQIQSICFSRLEFQGHLFCGACFCDCFLTRAQIEYYDFPSSRTNNTCNDFLVFYYFISYELFLEIAFLTIHGYFTFMKLKTQGNLRLC